MATLTIKNVGPIKEVLDLKLNKVNVFMGPQSSGKSTIAKIISHCAWIEKDASINEDLDGYDDFEESLEKFHKMKGYFKGNSFISYQSDVIEILYEEKKFSIKWANKDIYKRCKIAYIPSERNIVVMQEMEKVELPKTNIRSFLFDWFDARKTHPKKNKILGLGIQYYYNENKKEDRVLSSKKNDKYDILLSHASSGLQSTIPLVVMLEYLSNWIYHNEENESYQGKEQRDNRKKRFFLEATFEFINNSNLGEDIDSLKDFLDKIISAKDANSILSEDNTFSPQEIKLINSVLEYSIKDRNLFKTHFSNFIIEEPEQNLFPSTQRDLVYHLLKLITGERDHQLTITTHSPYVLYALNNCMMAGLVHEKMSEADKEKLKCLSSKIDPKSVSIYEIEDGKFKENKTKDGEVNKTIQRENGLISNNYFDQKMKELMDDFYVMLNYYGK